MKLLPAESVILRVDSSTDDLPAPPDSGACPRCRSASAAPFAAGGVCLRCAGVRVLAVATEGVADDAPATAAATDGGSGAADEAAGLPERIGAFEIIEELGRGGMARVFAARQIGLGRIVALKAIPAGRGLAADLELRFLREVQTVARLRHPHVVAVHDSGRSHGYVYFAMDFLEDGDLARRIRARPLSPRAAADLMRKVALALAYTHGEGVLHRDLKPSNILLEGDEPRVADFGLAAQLEVGGDLTAATGVLGTPHYVAPEALRGGSAALTVASDLYALGVILFELLTGRTPFAGVSPAELAAIADRVEPPAPRLLAPAVPGELETICLKCLEREPARRYGSAAELAEDLRRFLADEPIRARAPGAAERLARLVRRHRAAMLGAGAVFLALVAGTVASTAQAIRARRAERSAAAEAATARALADFLAKDLLGQASPGADSGRDLKLHTVLDRATERLDGRFPDQPLVAAALHETLGQVYAALGDAPAAQRHLERALELRRGRLPPDDPSVLGATSELGSVLHDLGKDEDAVRLLVDAQVRQSRVLGVAHSATLSTAQLRGLALRDLGNLEEAGVVLTEAVAAARKGPPTPDPVPARLLDGLATVRLRERKLAEAETLAREAVAMFRACAGEEGLETLTAENNLAVILRDAGKTAEALALQEHVLAVRRRVLPAGHPHILIAISNVAGLRKDLGRHAEAEALQLEALELHRKSPSLGPEHPRTLTLLRNLADTYRHLGNLTKAEALLRETLATGRQSLPPGHPARLSALASLGDVLVTQREFAAAVPYLREALAGGSQGGQTGPRAEGIRCRLGWALANLGEHAEAERLLVGGYQELTRTGVALPPSYRNLLREVGEQVVEFFTMTGRPAEAAAWRERIAARRP